MMSACVVPLRGMRAHHAVASGLLRAEQKVVSKGDSEGGKGGCERRRKGSERSKGYEQMGQRRREKVDTIAKRGGLGTNGRRCQRRERVERRGSEGAND